jgi:hypothetical protein
MPLFYLNLMCGSGVVPGDEEPQELENLEVARDEATQSLRELASNAIMQGRPFDYTAIEIADQDGTKLACVTATDAVPQLSKS